MDIISIFLKEFFTVSSKRPLNLFSPEHIIPIALMIIIIFYIRLNKQKIKINKNKKKIIEKTFIFLFLSQQFMLYFWYFYNGKFDLKDSLPLYLCRIITILCIVMIIRKSFKIFEVVYFWGLGGALQALITPDTSGCNYFSAMYIQFFVAHCGIIISIFYMMFVYDYIPNIKSLKKAINWNIIYLVFTYFFNFLVDGNYSYLRNKPLTPTILDHFPEYPIYIPIATLGIFFIYFLLYLPFSKKQYIYESKLYESDSIEVIDKI
ncbi:MAG: TIGR02206 family membrane protein [Peptostreptococcaceae bacterium]|jgi:hypothetical integral membrane protein (TIGR02206 family)|nr:TIGR02206 family membrane protein [Peptostreptococcaceae bacterium]